MEDAFLPQRVVPKGLRNKSNRELLSEKFKGAVKMNMMR